MVQYNTFYVPLTDAGEAQAQLNAFLRSHRILQVERQAFRDGWGFCVEWMENSAHRVEHETWRKASKVDYKEVLTPEVFERFSKLRERRKVIALEAGVPVYMVMTDAQLAEVAKLETPTAAEVGKIEGVGEARIAKYLERLLSE